MSGTPDVLAKIVAHKRGEVDERQKLTSTMQMREHALSDMQNARRGFRRSLERTVAAQKPAVIAEVKKASPSKGIIREDFDPVWTAQRYTHNGAACLSVLTDEKFFQGNDSYLQVAREATTLPVLRKDFMIDEFQIYESRVLGADCVLLIAAILNDAEMMHFSDTAQQLGMDVLVEVHDAEEMQRALHLDNVILGVNNRNLRTFKTTLDTTLELLEMVPDGRMVVTESGIKDPADVHMMRSQGVDAFLIGESLMRAEDPGAALAKLIG